MAQKLTVVVTGSTGKQGGAVARGLLERGHKVRAVTRDPNSKQAKSLAHAGATLVMASLEDNGSIAKAIEAEEIMVAANAQIGVAKASFFPNLSLTGLGGLESNALHKFISQPSETWYGAFNVSQPVFQGGALRSQLRLARANWQEASLSYQQTVQNALEQVSSSLVPSQKDREFREQQELLTHAAQQTDQLSEVLYRSGGASYLQVLTSETNYFSAELNLVEAQLNERLALVQLYQALGGGWQQ